MPPARAATAPRCLRLALLHTPPPLRTPPRAAVRFHIALSPYRAGAPLHPHLDGPPPPITRRCLAAPRRSSDPTASVPHPSGPPPPVTDSHIAPLPHAAAAPRRSPTPPPTRAPPSCLPRCHLAPPLCGTPLPLDGWPHCAVSPHRHSRLPRLEMRGPMGA
ncbi:hypothetical protein BS78_04G131100 [Paspalum vaginatum]|nr:hypothetical protein BS78_04G131100 [Paspalum vaginatum]